MSYGSIIGIDFDNTLVHYDTLLYQAAREAKLIDSDMQKDKKSIRDAVRLLPDGEKKWQKLQAYVYGSAIAEAKLMDGSYYFIQACKSHGCDVYIVSHKTQFAAMDTSGLDLRKAAMAWMRKNNFFNDDRQLMKPKDVFFESTRQEKINRIKDLGCTHFIDDLEETFYEPLFPEHVEKILYAPHAMAGIDNHILRFKDWRCIHDYFFGK